MQKIWTRLPVDLIGTVSNSALVLLTLLMNADRGTNTVTVSMTQLAEIMHCSVRQTGNLMRELEHAGLVCSRKRSRYATCLTLKPDILPPRRGIRPAAEPEPEPEPADSSILQEDLALLFGAV